MWKLIFLFLAIIVDIKKGKKTGWTLFRIPMKNWGVLLFDLTIFAAKIRQLTDISWTPKQLQVCFPLTRYNCRSIENVSRIRNFLCFSDLLWTSFMIWLSIWEPVCGLLSDYAVKLSLTSLTSLHIKLVCLLMWHLCMSYMVASKVTGESFQFSTNLHALVCHCKYFIKI